MKKILTAFIFGFILISFTSCSVDSDITFHKDSTASTEMNIDLRAFLEILKDSMFADSEIKEMPFDKFPNTWMSFYDYQTKIEKKQIPADSVAIYKKMLLKSNFEGKEMVGFSMKLDRFSVQEYSKLKDGKDSEIAIPNDAVTSWDGKTLKLNSEKFINAKLNDQLKMAENMRNSSKDVSKATDKEAITFSTRLKFENKIKSINGTHPWLKKVDDYTMKIDYDAKDALSAPEKSKQGNMITIITE